MKKYLAIFLALLMLAAAFAGCDKKQDPAPGTSTPVSDPSSQSQPYGIFRDYFTNCPTTLNMFATTDTTSQSLGALCSASLYTNYLAEDGKSYYWYGDLATDDYPVQQDAEGKVWRCALRPGYTWANGDALDANDVVYSVKQLLDPMQVNLTSTALTNNLYARLVNALEYQQQGVLGVMGVVSWEDVGIKKIDDLTIEITTTEKISAFKAMRFLSAIEIVYEPLYEAGKTTDGSSSNYGTNLETYMSAGPYTLTEWIPDAKFTLARNPSWLHSNLIKLEGISYAVVPSAQTALELFLNGELDTVALTYSDWENFEDDPRVHEFFGDSLMFMFVNLGNPNQGNILGKLDFRKALFYGCDRVALGNTLGFYPATRLVRRAVIGDTLDGVAFVDIPQTYVEDGASVYNVSKANEHLAKAYEQSGITYAEMEVLNSENSTTCRAATEILQKQWHDTFPGKLKVNIKIMPDAQTYQQRRWNPDDPDSYDTSLGSLVPSATDPRATFSFYLSTYSPPRFKYSNPTLDDIYAEASLLDLDDDNTKVIELCQKMEKMILDDLVVVPIFERPSKQLYSERVVLPTQDYIVGWGFGSMYCSIKK